MPNVDPVARTLVKAIVDMARLCDRSRDCRVAQAIIRTATLPLLSRGQRFARVGKGYHGWLATCLGERHGYNLKQIARDLKL